MENLVFTQLSIPEVRKLFRQELESFFNSNYTPKEEIENLKEALKIISEELKKMKNRLDSM